MKEGKVELYIKEMLQTKGAMLFTLIDPVDYDSVDDAVKTAKRCADACADMIVIGGSTEVQGEILDDTAKRIKEEVDVPIVLFPGNISTVTKYADAIYFMSMLNARNPYWITQAQMLSAPAIKKFNLEPLPLGYIIISPGGTAGWVRQLRAEGEAEDSRFVGSCGRVPGQQVHHNRYRVESKAAEFRTRAKGDGG